MLRVKSNQQLSSHQQVSMTTEQTQSTAGACVTCFTIWEDLSVDPELGLFSVSLHIHTWKINHCVETFESKGLKISAL